MNTSDHSVNEQGQLVVENITIHGFISVVGLNDIIKVYVNTKTFFSRSSIDYRHCNNIISLHIEEM